LEAFYLLMRFKVMLIKVMPRDEKPKKCCVWGDAPPEDLEMCDTGSQKEKSRESFSPFARQAI